MILCRKDAIEAARAILSAGQDVDAEVAIRTVREFYGNENTGTILQNYLLLIYAQNAFNVTIHNLDS